MITQRRVILTALICLGISGIALAALFNGPTEEVEEMSNAKNKSLQTTATPLIDAAAPDQTETATFSLG